MLKTIGKVFLSLFCCMVLFPQIVEAKEAELVDLDREQDIVIVISYDTEEPDITVVDPDGGRYSEDSDFAAVDRADTALYLYIEDAKAGTWKIDYDAKNNVTLEAAVMPWYHYLAIEDVEIGTVEDNRLPVKAKVSCEENVNYSYYVYAVTLDSDGNAEGKKELANGSGNSGRELDISVSTEGLIDGTYYLQLEAVITTDDGTEMPSFYTTDASFAVSGNVREADASGLISILDLTESTLYLDWSGADSSVSNWVLGVYLGDSEDPFYYESYEKDVTSDSIMLEEADGDIELTLTGAASADGYLRYEREIPWSLDMTVEFETPETTNALRGAIAYDTAGKTVRAVLTINDASEQLQLTDSGTVSFGLDEMEVNEVSLQYGWEEGSYYRISQRIAVDSIPPVLDIYGLPDQLTVTEQVFSVSGGTEAGAALTVNGEARGINEDGSFIVELSLQKGENTIVFDASDSAGNRTSRSLVVYYDPDGKIVSKRTSEGRDFPWALPISCVSGLIALLIMGLFGSVSAAKCRKEGVTKGAFLRKLLAVLEGLCCSVALIAGIASGLFIYLYLKVIGMVSGDRLPEMLKKYPVSDVAALTAQGIRYRNYAIASGAAAIVGLIVLLVLVIWGSRQGKRKS